MIHEETRKNTKGELSFRGSSWIDIILHWPHCSADHASAQVDCTYESKMAPSWARILGHGRDLLGLIPPAAMAETGLDHADGVEALNPRRDQDFVNLVVAEDDDPAGSLQPESRA